MSIKQLLFSIFWGGLFALLPYVLFCQTYIYTSGANPDPLNPGCVQMVSGGANQIGTVFAQQKISLFQPFDLHCNLYIDISSGPVFADGFAFVFQNEAPTFFGGGNSGLGFSGPQAPGVSSVAAELDFWGNGFVCESGLHHVTVHTNGDEQNCPGPPFLGSPIVARPGGLPLTSGACYNLRYVWDPGLMQLSMYVDDIFRFSWQNNIVANYFSLVDSVYWGFTAATGNSNFLNMSLCWKFSQAGTNSSQICRNQNATLSSFSAGAGASYFWSASPYLSCTNCPSPVFTPPVINGQNNFINTLVVTNSLGCRDTSYVTINVTDLPVANAGPDQTICSGDSVTLGVPTVPGYSYAWNPGTGLNFSTVPQPRASPLATTNYALVVTDNNTAQTCTNTDTMVLSLVARPTPVSGRDTTLCDSTLLLNGSALPIGGSGLWTSPTPSVTFTPNNAPVSVVNTPPFGTYSLIWSVTISPCLVRDTMVFTSNGPVRAIAGKDTTICDTSLILFGSVNGPSTGSWIDPPGGYVISNTAQLNSPITSLDSGFNLVSLVARYNNCLDTNSMFINVNFMELSAGEDTTVCGPNAPLHSVGNGTWSVVTGSGIFSDSSSNSPMVLGLAQGANTMRFAGMAGICLFDDTVSIEDFWAEPAIAGNDTTVCKDSLFLMANQPTWGVGQWNILSGLGNFSTPDMDTTWIITGQEGFVLLEWRIINGTCITTDQRLVRLDSVIPSDAGKDYSFCGPDYILEGNIPNPGNGTWTILPGSQGNFSSPNLPGSNYNNFVPGTNFLTWTIVNGACLSIDTVSLTKMGTAFANAGADSSFCADSLLLYANSPNSWESSIWSFVSGTGILSDSSNSISPLRVSGNDTLVLLWIVSDSVCSDSDQVQIEVFAPPVAMAGPDQTIPVNSSTFSATLPLIGTGIWYSATPSVTITVPTNPFSPVSNLSPGANYFEWVVSNGSVCPTSVDSIVITVTEGLQIPEAFSPNGDGSNEYFVIRGIEGLHTRLFIFNRWGNKVFESSNYANNWSGQNSLNQPLGDDTYYYLLEIPSNNTYKGFVVIKR